MLEDLDGSGSVTVFVPLTIVEIAEESDFTGPKKVIGLCPKQDRAGPFAAD